MLQGPNQQWPGMRPSPLAGMSEAAGTLVDSIIKGRERQAITQDYDLIGQALAKAGQMGEPTTGYGQESGDPYTITGKEADPMATWQEVLPQMRTPQGKMAILKMMIDQPPPQPLYSSEGQYLGIAKPNAKFLPKPADSTTVYDPKTGKSTQVPGRFAQIKEEPATTVMTPQGPVQVPGKVIFDPAYKEGVKRFKPELFEGPNGERKWVAPGEEVLPNYQIAGKTGKDDPTGYTREGISWMKTVGLDPQKKDSWDTFNGFRRKSKDKDSAMWALDKATAILFKNSNFQDSDDSQWRAAMVIKEAENILLVQKHLQGKEGGPAGREAVPAGGASPRLYNKKTGQWENVDQATYDAVKKRQSGMVAPAGAGRR